MMLATTSVAVSLIAISQGQSTTGPGSGPWVVARPEDEGLSAWDLTLAEVIIVHTAPTFIHLHPAPLRPSVTFRASAVADTVPGIRRFLGHCDDDETPSPAGAAAHNVGQLANLFGVAIDAML